LKITATIFPVYDFTRAVTGELNRLTMLVPPGASIHSYEPSIADIERIDECDIFICIGGADEAWIDLPDIDSIDSSKVIRLIEQVELLEEHHGHYDEHIWTNPVNAVKLINVIADVLIQVDSANESVYRCNADSYIAQLQELDDYIIQIVSSAPRREIIMADKFAMRYFTEHYGLLYTAAFHSCSDQSDASLATIARLVDAVIDGGFDYIFCAESGSGNVAAVIAAETGTEVLLLHSCQSVTRAEFDAGETYITLMQKNAENLKTGLS